MPNRVHHIHPHLIPNHNSDNDSDVFSDFDDPFDKILNNMPKGNQNQNNSHSFTASYSNVNGHVKKHFTKNGHTISAGKAQNIMKHMNQNANSFLDKFGKFSKDGLNDAIGYGKTLHKQHPLRKLINKYHHKNNDKH